MSARAVPVDRGLSLPRLPRWLLPVVVLAGGLFLLVRGGEALLPRLDAPVTGVRVEGTLQHLKATAIVRAAALPAEARLFSVDLEAMRSRVESLPWVAHARVSRVWPDHLTIRVEERQPYARWGTTQLIDRESRVFTPAPTELEAGLPQLDAPEGHEAEVAATFETLRAALAQGPFVPTGLTLDARGDWRMSTARGITLRLGQNDPRTQLALIEGVVTRTLTPELDRVAYVDLRYTNGFAVGWRDGREARSVDASAHKGMHR